MLALCKAVVAFDKRARPAIDSCGISVPGLLNDRVVGACAALGASVELCERLPDQLTHKLLIHLAAATNRAVLGCGLAVLAPQVEAGAAAAAALVPAVVGHDASGLRSAALAAAAAGSRGAVPLPTNWNRVMVPMSTVIVQLPVVTALARLLHMREHAAGLRLLFGADEHGGAAFQRWLHAVTTAVQLNLRCGRQGHAGKRPSPRCCCRQGTRCWRGRGHAAALL